MIVLKIASVLIAFLAYRISAEESLNNVGLRAIIRVYDECQKSENGFSPCIKKKAITFIDRVSTIDAINVGDGINVVKSIDDSGKKVPIDTAWEQTLPRGLEAKDDALTNILVDRVSNLISGRTIKVTLPTVSADEIGRGLEEGS